MPRFHLTTLGRLALAGDGREVEDLTKRRRKLALLALLALAKQPLSRDALVDIFWGEEPEERARHSLSDALSHLRRVLGKDAILARQADVALTAAASLGVDVLDLRAASARGDHAAVVALHAGPFLDVIHISDSMRFEAWVTRERASIERAFRASAAAACLASSRDGRWEECAGCAQRWLDADPESSDAARYLQHALRELATLPAAPPIEALPIVVRPVEPVAAPRWRRPGWLRRAGAVSAFVAAAAMLTLWVRVSRSSEVAAAGSRQVIAIVEAETPRGDSSLAWLTDGLPKMIASSLSRTAAVEVVPPERIRALLVRRGAGWRPLDDAAALDVARSLGARWAVRTSLHRSEGAYVLQLTVGDAGGAAVRSFAISGTSLLSVSDEAAARVRAIADAAAPGPHLADVETANIDALEHFVRSDQAGAEGRFGDMTRELDAAIAADSGFTSAIVARMRQARASPDSVTVARLARAWERAASRVTRWDALEMAGYLAMHNGEHARAEALGRELLAAYPHDPRAYQTLAATYSTHARWAAADSVLVRALALDSLAIATGHGPCAPCAAFGGEIVNRLQLGDLASAERTARRWLAVQPELPSVWSSLATVLAFSAQYDKALEAARHAAALAGDEPEYAMRIGRILVMARRFGDVDTLVRRLRSEGPAERLGALDLQSVTERERGEHHAAEATLRRVEEEFHDGGLLLVHANALARVGRYADASREYEALPHLSLGEPASPVQSLAGDRARSFAWHHALEADALAPSGDTVRLRILADSIERIGSRSYYARDWGLHHHVRGLIALRAGRAGEAVREFEMARFGVAGWTRTNEGLAEARLALGDAAGALAALRSAYQSPPDAMGRYLPRSELDYWMARAFLAAGAVDSARVYTGYVAAAWAKADPEVRARRDELVRAVATGGRGP